jgi:trehalose-phosphatase
MERGRGSWLREAIAVRPWRATITRAPRPIQEIPLALHHADWWFEPLTGRRPVILLDFDGTLAPIVEEPTEAGLSPSMREAISRLAALLPVGVVSGRDREDVRRRVGLDQLTYAGSHGLDVRFPDGRTVRRGEDARPALERVRTRLAMLPDDFPGARLEPKALSLAVHYRLVDPSLVQSLEERVDGALEEEPTLRRASGKKVFEIRPDVEWDKGRAAIWLADVLASPVDPVVFVGDDVTDEDAFEALAGRGLALVVRGEDDTRPSAADYALRGPDEVQTLLYELAERVRTQLEARKRESETP